MLLVITLYKPIKCHLLWYRQTFLPLQNHVSPIEEFLQISSTLPFLLGPRVS